MGLCRSLRILIDFINLKDFNAFFWVFLGLYGPFRSFFVLMDSNGSLLVFISPHASLWILMGPYGFLCVLIGPYVSLCVYVDFNGS